MIPSKRVQDNKPTNEAGAAVPLRRLGRFELRALLAKSARSMSWLVLDTRSQQEMIICLPRTAPATPELLADWLQSAQAGARVQHPNLGHAVEVSNVEHWPYIAYDRVLGETLAELLARNRAPLPVEVAQWLGQALEGLAFAHEAGHAHRDLQLSNIVVDQAGHVRVLGLEVAQDLLPPGEFSTAQRRAVREAAEEDVVSIGLLLHRLLGAHPVLDQEDLQMVLQRMQPTGRELVRLPFETPHQVPAPLRAIANRATDRQARQRYHSARSLLHALDGWRRAATDSEDGPVKAMLDRVQRVGHLPSVSTRLHQVAQSKLMLTTPASELATLALQDMALC
ncbi:MAG TPA: protein kinase, partial [Burkholderiaceae bacterium]